MISSPDPLLGGGSSRGALLPGRDSRIGLLPSRSVRSNSFNGGGSHRLSSRLLWGRLACGGLPHGGRLKQLEPKAVLGSTSKATLQIPSNHKYWNSNIIKNIVVFPFTYRLELLCDVEKTLRLAQPATVAVFLPCPGAPAQQGRVEWADLR